MREPTKSLKRLVREYASRAHEEELRRALLELADAFDGWRAGKISNGELSDRIHRFHDGTAREIFKSYSHRLVEQPLARAIAEGVLDRSQVPGELLEYLAGAIEFYEAEDARS
jgi:hypothetical protein